MNQGRFIVVEGLEGAGKSTAISYIKSILEPHCSNLILTREPGGTDIGESIRSIVKNTYNKQSLANKSELLLMYAARIQLVETIIKPALKRGDWVLADRFELSTFAYQGSGRGLCPNFLNELSKFCLGALQPDLIIYLDIPPELGLQRIKKRGKKDRIEQEDLAFFQSVQQGYQTYMSRYKYVRQIDATKKLPEVQSQILRVLTQFIDHYE